MHITTTVSVDIRDEYSDDLFQRRRPSAHVRFSLAAVRDFLLPDFRFVNDEVEERYLDCAFSSIGTHITLHVVAILVAAVFLYANFRPEYYHIAFVLAVFLVLLAVELIFWPFAWYKFLRSGKRIPGHTMEKHLMLTFILVALGSSLPTYNHLITLCPQKYEKEEVLYECYRFLGPELLATFVFVQVQAPRTIFTIPVMYMACIISFFVGPFISLRAGGNDLHDDDASTAVRGIYGASIVIPVFVLTTYTEKSLREMFMEMCQSHISSEKMRRAAIGNRVIVNAMLPPAIVERLSRGLDPSQVVESAPGAVLVADIAGFTRWCSSLNSSELVVNFLASVFSRLDQSGTDMGVLKVKTVGDAYWAVCGLLPRVDNFVQTMYEFSQICHNAIVEEGKRYKNCGHLRFRIGMHCGTVTGALVGNQRLSFEVLGETLQLAELIEQAGTPGKTLVSSVFAEGLPDGCREVSAHKTITGNHGSQVDCLLLVYPVSPPKRNMMKGLDAKSVLSGGSGSGGIDLLRQRRLRNLSMQASKKGSVGVPEACLSETSSQRSGHRKREDFLLLVVNAVGFSSFDVPDKQAVRSDRGSDDDEEVWTDEVQPFGSRRVDGPLEPRRSIALMNGSHPGRDADSVWFSERSKPNGNNTNSAVSTESRTQPQNRSKSIVLSMDAGKDDSSVFTTGFLFATLSEGFLDSAMQAKFYEFLNSPREALKEIFAACVVLILSGVTIVSGAVEEALDRDRVVLSMVVIWFLLSVVKLLLSLQEFSQGNGLLNLSYLLLTLMCMLLIGLSGEKLAIVESISFMTVYVGIFIMLCCARMTRPLRIIWLLGWVAVYAIGIPPAFLSDKLRNVLYVLAVEVMCHFISKRTFTLFLAKTRAKDAEEGAEEEYSILFRLLVVNMPSAVMCSLKNALICSDQNESHQISLPYFGHSQGYIVSSASPAIPSNKSPQGKSTDDVASTSQTSSPLIDTSLMSSLVYNQENVAISFIKLEWKHGELTNSWTLPSDEPLPGITGLSTSANLGSNAVKGTQRVMELLDELLFDDFEDEEVSVETHENEAALDLELQKTVPEADISSEAHTQRIESRQKRQALNPVGGWKSVFQVKIIGNTLFFISPLLPNMRPISDTTSPPIDQSAAMNVESLGVFKLPNETVLAACGVAHFVTLATHISTAISSSLEKDSAIVHAAVHVGSTTGGVLGKQQLIYDVFGTDVNTTSRLLKLCGDINPAPFRKENCCPQVTLLSRAAVVAICGEEPFNELSNGGVALPLGSIELYRQLRKRGSDDVIGFLEECNVKVLPPASSCVKGLEEPLIHCQIL